MPAPRRAAGSALLSLLCLGLGCAEFAAPTQSGVRFRLTIRTNGQDPDGYLLSVDHGRPTRVPDNHAIVYPDLPRLVHSFQLSDLAAGCVLGGPNPVQVDLTLVDPPLAQDITVGCAPPPAP